MKLTHLAISAIAFAVTASLALVVIRLLGVGDTPLSFVVGAIVGSLTGAILHANLPDSVPSVSSKLALGASLAMVAVFFGIIVHLTAGGIKYPEVTLPIAAIGSSVFRFLSSTRCFTQFANQRNPIHNVMSTQRHLYSIAFGTLFRHLGLSIV